MKETKAEFDRLNARSFEYQTLKREAEGDKKLYEELVRKIKEAGINASFQNSSIRVADPARPGLKPVFPKMWLNVLLAFLFATFLSVGAAVLSDVLDNTVRDPDQVSRLMNADVIGSLPAVKDWRRHLSPIQGISVGGRACQRESARNGTCALWRERMAKSDQALSNYEEAIRTLRNSILLTDFDRRLRSVLLTSASPSEGKSTVAAHLAATHASQHKRTLLIDGDLRRPSVHRLYQVPNSVGLSNVLLQQISWRDAVIRIDDPEGLDILPAGPSTRRASDLIGHGAGGTDRGSHARVRPGGAGRAAAAGLRRAAADGDGGGRSDRGGARGGHEPEGAEFGDHDADAAAGESGGRGAE